MKKSILLLTFAAISLAAMAVTKTVGTTGADYATLKAAFDAINDNMLSSPIELQIIDNTTETATALLSKAGVTVTIYPTVTGKSISGSIAGNLIQLGSGSNNVISNVTIDGRLRNSSGDIIGTQPDLTIENTSNSTSASTIYFNNASSAYVTNSIVTYCIIKGSSQRAENSGGMIHIHGGHASQTGVEFSYNKITASSGGRPINAIWVGSSSVATYGLKILSNNFENVVGTNGIRIYNKSVNLEIKGNSFYETAAFTPAAAYSFIKASGSASPPAINASITENYMGGSGPECEGTMTTTGSPNYKLIPINIDNCRTDNGIIIGYNTIKNITWTNNGTETFTGIYLNMNNTDVTPNTPSQIYGNFIANINFSNSGGATTVTGIYHNNKNVYIFNNVISMGSDHRATVNGIRTQAGANALNIANIYNNTVYIKGTQSGGNENSYAFYSHSNALTRDFRNNIFYNARTNSSTSSKHYAIYLNYSAMVPDPNTNGVTFTCDYNDYYVTGTGGVLGYAGSDKSTLAAFQAATGQDEHSTDATPSITSPGSTLLSYKGTEALTGVVISDVPTDILGNERTSSNHIGAFQITGPSSKTNAVKSEISIYQNAKNSLIIASKDGASIAIYNLTGTSVKKINAANRVETISLPAGAYIVSVNKNGRCENHKVIVQ